MAGVRGRYFKPSTRASAAERMPAPRDCSGSPLFLFFCSLFSTSSPSLILPRSTSLRSVVFFFCFGASSRASLEPMSRMLIRPAKDSGSPVTSSLRRVEKRLSCCKTKLDIAAYLYCEMLLGSAILRRGGSKGDYRAVLGIDRV